MKDYNIWQMLEVQYWGAQEIEAILANSGYGANDIVSASYNGPMANGVVFKVEYDDRAGEAGTGNVYIKPNTDGFLRAEY